MAASARTHRFLALDALRGAAAVAVMLYHYGQMLGAEPFPATWIAVDLFFVLSGFVIAHGYAARIVGGMGLRPFLVLRLVRLGPLYQVGFALGAVVLLAGAAGAWPRAAALGLNAVGLPFLSLADVSGGRAWLHAGSVFPGDPPFWSLFFEVVANIAFFLYLRAVRELPGAFAAAGLAAAMVAATVWVGIPNPGWSVVGFWVGVPRAVALFFAGAALYRLGVQRGPVRPAAAAMAAALLLLLARHNGVWPGLAAQLVVIPVLIAALAPVAPRGRAAALCQALGELSYPLYVVHFPIYGVVMLLPWARALPPGAGVVLGIAVSVLLATALVPLDARIRRALLRARPVAAG